MDKEHFWNSNEDIYHLFISLTIGQEINKKISHRLAFSNGGCPSSYNTLQLKPRGSPLIMQTLKSLLWNTHYHGWYYLRKYSNYIWSIRTLDLSLTTWESISKFNQVVFPLYLVYGYQRSSALAPPLPVLSSHRFLLCMIARFFSLIA